MHTHGVEARAVPATRAEWESWGGTRAVPEESGGEVRGTHAAREAREARDGEERSAVRGSGKPGARPAESGEEGPMKVEELVETVYELLVRRLRADSRLDRERRGLFMGSRF
ncbi:hypothetical protein ACIBKY_17550 [Nonomuraea sp. NPDC050394]|uniref:hypothetical protein n=1 Tax=Nonomuraea sp. NPDC050394 TaxID=3364363 RepID=UPI0037A2919B